MSDILTVTEMNALKGMSIYWREAFHREPPDERRRIMDAELASATQMMGSEKVLRILSKYVEAHY